MYLILLRHGVAQDKALGFPDFDRILTESGRKKLNKFFPKCIDYIHELCKVAGISNDEIELWTSPKLRAVETAEVLAKMSSWPITRTDESLESDDLDAFMKALNESEAKIVIASGHEPGLGIWTNRLTAKDTRFKKGSMVVMKLDSKEPRTKAHFIDYLKP